MSVLASPTLPKEGLGGQGSLFRSPCGETINSVALVPVPKSAKRSRRMAGSPKQSTKKARTTSAIDVASDRPHRVPSPTVMRRSASLSQSSDLSLLLTPHSITERALKLFGTSKGVLSRIFSCYSLQLAEGHPTSSTTSCCSTPLRRSSPCVYRHRHQGNDQVGLLIKALVELEVVSLPAESRPPSEEPRRNRFCSWSSSVVSPPIDRVDGSSEHMNQVLEALIAVQDLIQTALSASDAAALKKAVAFLAAVQDKASTLAELCARSVSETFSVKRVVQEAKVCHGDLSLLLHRLEGDSVELPPRTTPYLQVEERLATWLGQAIRYNLRMLLNPAPPRLGPADVNYEVRTQSFSQVADAIELTGGDQTSDAVREVNLSTLVSKALGAIYQYHGDTARASNLPSTVPQHGLWSLDQSPLLQTILGKPRRDRPPIEKTPELAASLKEVVVEASAFLECHSAAQFLVDLFRLDIVRSEVERCGGTEDLETYATMLWKFNLSSVCDAHLVLLGNVPALIERLSIWTQQTQAQADEARATLHALHKKVKKWPREDRFGLDTELNARLVSSQFMPRVTGADIYSEETGGDGNN